MRSAAASGVVDSPAVGASDEERADWRYAHEAAIVHVLSRMPASALNSALNAWRAAPRQQAMLE